jgi:hypothetical protein
MNIPDSTRKEVHELVAAGRKAEAVKRLQEVLKVSPAKAYRAMEFLLDEARPAAPAYVPSKPMVDISLPKPLWIMLYIFLAIGIGGFGTAVILYFNQRAFQQEAAHVEGTVVEVAQSGRHRTPIFEFPWDGGTRTARGNVRFRGSILYAVGERYPLWVSRADPTDVRIDTWSGSWLGVTIAVAMGFVFTLLSTLGLITFRKR